jgi:hypothetical protein
MVRSLVFWDVTLLVGVSVSEDSNSQGRKLIEVKFTVSCNVSPRFD